MYSCNDKDRSLISPLLYHWEPLEEEAVGKNLVESLDQVTWQLNSFKNVIILIAQPNLCQTS